MPVVPVLPGVAGLDGWSLWQRGRITAANVTWSADASDSSAQQNFILTPLAVNKSYNAIRLVLSAGSNTAGWFDMLQIAQQGWDDSSTTLVTSGQPISEIAANIDAILVKCAQLGLGVILDCHDFLQRDQDDGSTGELWVGSNAASYRQLLQDFWTKTVTRWGPTNWPNVWSSQGQTDAAGPSPVIGYELLNEPNPDPSLTFTQMQAQEDNNWWALADKCIKAIRQLDATTPIVVDGIYYAAPHGLKYFDATSTGARGPLYDYTYSSGSGSYAFKAAADARIVYSFHFYGPRDYTHQGVEDGLYAALGLLYPLNKRTAGAVMHTRWHDGAVSSGATQKDGYLSFNGYTDLLARVQPALDFHTNNPSVPIFVGEFSAVNPALLGSEQVSSTAAHSRVITKIEVIDGAAKVTLQSNPSINFYPQGQNGGPYNDYALAKIENATNAAYDYSTFVAVRIEDGNPIWKTPSGAAAFQYSNPPTGTLGGGSTQVATLTLKPAASAADIDAARCAYIKDVLQMCLTQGFSWGYWAEDGYVADAATVDTLPSGVFIGWRPSPAMSSLLTLAATRRTVSKS
ncbi:glycoside hydrolase family 5 protein [Aquabacterium sp.]|uniref:glycoside hydrolase family 5 protein n=1 Tax=Aquabacterium sp. TaxID=1872578 RepID=UPI0035AE5149